MVRVGVIFGLLFQSLLLLWCAAPASLVAATAGGCCEVETEFEEEATCCREPANLADEAVGAEWQTVRATRERCCECPLTVEDPRVPVRPERRPVLELFRLSGLFVLTPVLNMPERIGARIASVPAMVHPPDFAGRFACERFCRWTI
ncbi:MAG: hypothetical protein KF691_14410 [Phycisphaeraceae bacterium]|nr:hypothetical protein [Phycisphaeraceae bacterium]